MPVRVLNLGAGVQSTTIYLLALDGEIKVDCAIFADTGEEPAAVYKHLSWVESLGGPPIHRVARPVRLGDNLKAGLNATGNRFVSIPAFTKSATEPGRVGILRRQCTSEYKITVIEKAIRRKVLGLRPGQRAKPLSVIQLFGLSFDEPRRIESLRKQFAKKKWASLQLPLVEMEWGRRRCMDYLKTKVPHQVPRSACVFCPYHGNAEWLWIKENDPLGWARAVEVDAALRHPDSVCNRKMEQETFVHRSCVPLDQADFGGRDTLDLFSAAECAGACGV